MSYRNAQLETHNYYSDHRVSEALRPSILQDVDTEAMTAVFEEDDGEGEPVFHTVRLRFAVCHVCEGRGKHVNPAIDAGGLTAEDFYDDPDFAEDYFAGTYDVPCQTCDGFRVVPVVDRNANPKALLALLDEAQADANVAHREHMAELRFGC